MIETGRGFDSGGAGRTSFLLHGQLSMLSLISVSVALLSDT